MPVEAAFFADQAPASWRGTLPGINQLAAAAASLVSGRLGGLYETWPPSLFWLLHAAICAGAGLILLIAAPRLQRLFAQDEAEAGTPERAD